MAKIIAIVNQKGGVGKHDSHQLKRLYWGPRPLLIDVDPQGNSTSGLGIESRGCAIPYMTS